jgi:hypothetical protein
VGVGAPQLGRYDRKSRSPSLFDTTVVIAGEICVGNISTTESVALNRTYLLMLPVVHAPKQIKHVLRNRLVHDVDPSMPKFNPDHPPAGASLSPGFGFRQCVRLAPD